MDHFVEPVVVEVGRPVTTPIASPPRSPASTPIKARKLMFSKKEYLRRMNPPVRMPFPCIAVTFYLPGETKDTGNLADGAAVFRCRELHMQVQRILQLQICGISIHWGSIPGSLELLLSAMGFSRSPSFSWPCNQTYKNVGPCGASICACQRSLNSRVPAIAIPRL